MQKSGEERSGIELRKRTLGVVGRGAIGLSGVEIGDKGFEMKAVGYDPFIAPPTAHDFEKRVGSRRDLLQQAEIVEQAVDEYVERHRAEFAARIERARIALLGGEAATVAYMSGVTEEDVARLGGVKPSH